MTTAQAIDDVVIFSLVMVKMMTPFVIAYGIALVVAWKYPPRRM